MGEVPAKDNSTNMCMLKQGGNRRKRLNGRRRLKKERECERETKLKGVLG